MGSRRTTTGSAAGEAGTRSGVPDGHISGSQFPALRLAAMLRAAHDFGLDERTRGDAAVRDGGGAADLNFTAEDRVREAFGEERDASLVAIKDRYDPGNLFRLNQNIVPSGQVGEPALT